jgi:transposase
MIPVPSGVRVWLAIGRTDMRKGMNGLRCRCSRRWGRDPHAGDLYVFRGASGNLLKNRLARRHRNVALRQTVGARPVHLALSGRRVVAISAAR